MRGSDSLSHPPRIFISYAQYDADHTARVLELAYALATDGLAVELDQFHRHELIDWPRWCAERLDPANTDFVLMVCSLEYRRRIEGQIAHDVGRGVFWEGDLIYGSLYRAKANERFVLVLLDDTPENALPPVVASWNRFRLHRFGIETGDQGYEALYRLLTGQPTTAKPSLGPLKRLPPRPAPAAHRPGPDVAEMAPTRGAAVLVDSAALSRGVWIFGSLLLLFLVAVFTFAPASLPEYKQRILALCAALLAGLLGWFLSGEIGLRLDALASRFGDLAVRASGGLALFVLVLGWWLSPLAPVASSQSSIENGYPPPLMQPQALAGTIRNAHSGAPLSGVQVSLAAYGLTVESDALGRFRLQVEKPDQTSVELMARKPGYQVHEQYATLGNTSLDIDLKETP
ncbi:hypothetical protein MARPU_08505 [Marichromatium purpuratum 984]|uniref:SEFIR domain-containing protein n=1 Tax=Marichromatium purpuratum 984 TaxID=765910 RepID=W0E3P0_MARPU|nr:carboxypeptidase regulatory-like domain-containing protein [Marichromatium purpuratum]AHF05480.1 hypothetical protein MARPU_08505 [Marichromatium purpuratum 984]